MQADTGNHRIALVVVADGLGCAAEIDLGANQV